MNNIKYSHCVCHNHRKYKGCLESIQPFWISQEPVAWPWCNLAAGQRRPYCAFVNSHSPVGLVSRQWDAIDWACVLCDHCIHKSPPFQRWFYLWKKPEVAGTWLMWCFTKKACTRAVEWAGALSWWSRSACSIIVNVTVTQYTSSVNGVSLPTD